MNATQIIQWLQKNGLILTPDMAVEAALQGRWVIAGWLNPDPTGHSHVCTIYPAEMQISTTYGGPVPMVANVGESNGIMRLSGAFAKIREPLLYLV